MPPLDATRAGKPTRSAAGGVQLTPENTKVHIVKAADVGKEDAGETRGMKRSSALFGCSDKMCSLVMDAQPNSSSAVHHHGDQDTIVYSLSGRGYIAYGPDASQRHEILPGDHALIPAYMEHQEVNPTDEPIRWIIIRSGSKPVTENIEDWGASQKK